MTYTLTVTPPTRWFSPKTRFFLSFLMLSIGAFVLFYQFQEHFQFLLSGTATILGQLLSLIGIHSTVSGSLLSFSNVTFSIIYECTALFPAFLFTAAVIAYPARIHHTLGGIGAGIALIYAANLLRLIILSIVGIHYPQAFKFVHSFLWESIFLVFVILLFLIWIRWQVSHHD